jgi:hypothetical protein
VPLASCECGPCPCLVKEKKRKEKKGKKKEKRKHDKFLGRKLSPLNKFVAKVPSSHNISNHESYIKIKASVEVIN